MNGKGQHSTHHKPKTPLGLPIFAKIGMHAYVVDVTRHAKML